MRTRFLIPVLSSICALLVAAVAVIAVTRLGGDGNSEAAALAACRDELASTLRDPDSLEIEDGVETEQGEEAPHGWLVSGTYRARNGFGGMNSDFFSCVYSPDDDEATILTGEQLDP